MRAPDLEKLEILILARVSVPMTKPIGPARLGRDLEGFVSPNWTPGEWRVAMNERLAALRAADELQKERLSPTEKGAARVRDVLGLGPGVLPDWRTIKRDVLPALGLELEPSAAPVKRRMRDAGGVRAAILREHYDLPVGPTPTLTAALDALVWRHLGVRSDQRLSLDRLRAHALSALAGTGDANWKAEKLASIVTAQCVIADSPDADSARLALARRWLTGEEAMTAGAGEPAGEARGVEAHQAGIAAPAGHMMASSPRPLSLEELARRVRGAAAEQARRAGADSAYISAVWRALRSDPAFGDMNADTFKEQLVEANRRGLLTLHAADMVGADNPEEVRASEARSPGGPFHVVETGHEHRPGA